MIDTPQTVVDAFVTNTTDTAAAPKVVPLSDGTFLAAYSTEIGSELGFNIRGQVFDTLGAKVGPEIPFVFNRDIDEREFSVVSLERNRVAIAVEIVKGDDDIEIETRLFRVDEDRAFVLDGTFHRVGGIARNAIFSPTLTGAGGEDYKLHFVQRRAGVRSIQAAGLVGNEVIGPSRVIVFGGSDDAVLDSATLENGDVVVVLDRDGASGNDHNLHYRVIQSNGSTVESGETGAKPFRLPGFNALIREETFDSTVSALTGGGFVVAWTQRPNPENFIGFEIFDAQGEALTDGSLPVGASNNDNEPTIAPLEDGGFILFYDQDAGALQVRGQRFDSAGNEVGDDFLVADENGLQLDATLLPGGRIAVTYLVAGTGTTKAVILAVDLSSETGDPSLAGAGSAA